MSRFTATEDEIIPAEIYMILHNCSTCGGTL